MSEPVHQLPGPPPGHVYGPKPIGRKNYGSIPHLPGSRRGPSDRGVSPQQAELATGRLGRDYEVIVQEKLDGSNVGVARVGDELIALTRSGHRADASPFEQHRVFARWAASRAHGFRYVLADGERLCGEWLALAHGTRYALDGRDPFVAFDIMRGEDRLPHEAFHDRIGGAFAVPPLLHRGGGLPLDRADELLGQSGHYGAEWAEGVVYRIERDVPTGNRGEKVRRLLFVAKYVRPGKEDGAYFDGGSKWQGAEVWNWVQP